jgi:hypothetical protein
MPKFLILSTVQTVAYRSTSINLEQRMGTYIKALQQLYVAYYNRPGDPAGLEYWNGVVEAQGGSTIEVSAAFASSQEYVSVYGGKDNRTVVNMVYHNLFGRDGEKAGVDYWAGLLDSRAITVDGVVTAIAGGARDADLVAYDNKVKFATAFSEALDVHPERAAYNGNEAIAYAKLLTSGITTDASLATALADLDASTASFVAVSKAPIIFTLSSNADAGIAFKGGGGNDTFNATGTTFSTGDSLNGGGGSNSLVIVDDGAALASGLPGQAKVTNVQNVIITTKGGVGNVNSYDMSGFTGLEKVNITAAGGVNLKVGDSAEVAVKTTAGAVTTNGGHAVSVTGNTAAATLTGNALISVSLAETNQAATINNSSSADHALTLRLTEVGNAATVTDATAKTVNLQVNALPAGKGSDINLAAANASTLNIDNGTNFHLTTTALAAADKLATMTLKGAGTFSADLSGIAPLTVVDASLSTGANTLKIAGAPGLSVKGGSGTDDIAMTGQLSSTANVQLGAGNDRYDFVQAAQGGAKVDAGLGSDIIVINDAALLGTSGAVVYSNFETLDFSSGKGLYDLDRVGSVTTLHSHARLRADVEFTNGRADSKIELVSQDINLDLTGKPSEQFVVGTNIKFSLKDGSGANDKLTISMTATDSRADGRINGFVEANTIEANGIETLSIHSTVSKVEVDNPATSTNEGRSAKDYVNGLTKLVAEGSKVINVTGDASLDLHYVYSNTLTTFDASGSTGDMFFDGLMSTGTGAKTPLNYIGSQATDYYLATESGVVFQGNGGLDTVQLYRYEKTKDIIKFAKASDSTLSFATADRKEVSAYDTIYDFQVGTDKIDLSGLHLADGANRGGFATITLASNTHHILEAALKNGVGVFNDGSVNRSIAFAMHGVDDGFMLVDTNGDGNYTAGTDMIFNMYGNTAIPVMSDFIF